MLNKKLLTAFCLVAGMLLPQGMWADSGLSNRTTVNNELFKVFVYGTNKANWFSAGGGSFSVNSNVVADNVDYGWNLVASSTATLSWTCPTGITLAAGDKVSILASFSSASTTDGILVRRTGGQSTDTGFTLVPGSSYSVEGGASHGEFVTLERTLTASDTEFIGAGGIKFNLTSKTSAIPYIRSITITRSGVDDRMPNVLGGNKTWDFSTIGTTGTTVDRNIVNDDLFYGCSGDAGTQMQFMTKITDYTVLRFEATGSQIKTLPATSNGNALVFIVPKGKGTVAVQHIARSDQSSNATNLKYAVGSTTGTLVESSTSATAFTTYYFTYDVDVPTPVWIYSDTKPGYSCLGSISVALENTLSIPINTIDYATFSSPFHLDFTGSNADAYIVTAEAKGVLTYKKVTKVPAKTGLLLAGTAGTPCTPTVISEAAATDDVSDNKIKPTLVKTTVGTTTGADYGKVWVLGNLNSTPGFYKSNNGRSLAVGKAYLYLDGGISEAREFYAFDFEDETTGISNSKLGIMNSDQVIFDLQGRRVAQPTKGLYIVNGKKVVIK